MGWSRSPPKRGFTLLQSRVSACLRPQVCAATPPSPNAPKFGSAKSTRGSQPGCGQRQLRGAAMNGANPQAAGTGGLDTSGSISQANAPLPRVALSPPDLSNGSLKPICPLQHPTAPVPPRYQAAWEPHASFGPRSPRNCCPWAQPRTEPSHPQRDRSTHPLPTHPAPGAHPWPAAAGHPPPPEPCWGMGTPTRDVPRAGGMEPTHPASGARRPWGASAGHSGCPVLGASAAGAQRSCAQRGWRTRALGWGDAARPCPGPSSACTRPRKAARRNPRGWGDTEHDPGGSSSTRGLTGAPPPILRGILTCRYPGSAAPAHAGRE